MAGLAFAPFGADGTPGTAVRLHAAADPPIAALFPTVPRVLFTDSLSAGSAGLYVSGVLMGTTAQLALAPTTALDGSRHLRPLSSRLSVAPGRSGAARAAIATGRVPFLVASPPFGASLASIRAASAVKLR